VIVDYPAITIGGIEYRLRYTIDDIRRIEADLGIGYIFLFAKEHMSFTWCGVLFRRGLRTIDTQGNLVYATSQSTSDGLADAGEILHTYLSTQPLAVIYGLVYSAFVASGWVVSHSETTSGDPDPLAVPVTETETKRGRGRRPR